ncbi:hypothetical protein VTJ04DRAFT_5199 [Mycothermus thermophilus]|uniref:uncharacterized protein n=1 Tax=Humicola insolens TaxID=85995 RepID=UPI00374330A1
MSENTVYLITGANRGIGLAITAHLLTRPHTTVIATARSLDPNPFAVLNEKTHPTSRLIPFQLDVTSSSSLDTLVSRLRDEHTIASVDVVIANAGTKTGFGGVLSGDLAERARRDWEVNVAGGVMGVLRGVWPLLKPSDGNGEEEGGKGKRVKKFVLMSSSVGSIGGLETEFLPAVTGYGMSKAAANYFVKMAGKELQGRLAVAAVHPGWVKTDMGQDLADELGAPEPPVSVEESIEGVVKQIDDLTYENSGRFVTWNGVELPW